MPRRSGAESFDGASFRLGSLFFPILRRRGGFERPKQAHRYRRYVIDSAEEGVLICLRRFIETADLSNELDRCRPDLFRVHGWLKIEKRLNIPAHRNDLGIELCDTCLEINNLARLP